MVDINEFFLLIVYFQFVLSNNKEFQTTRIERDTYDEREKLLSTYKIISKTQCLLKMRSYDGYVYAKSIIDIDDSQETNDGTFRFLPIAVNLFLIQHKQSQRYLCGRNNQLIGLFEINEYECLFETKRSDIDFGYWDSYHLFYQNSNHGYLSISYKCHARLRKKYSNDNYLNFLAFIRINTDLSLTYYNQTNKLQKSFRNLLVYYLSDE